MSLLHRRSLAVLLAASLGAVAPATAVAQDDSISTVVEAVGGADALGALDGIVVSASGTRGAMDEGPVPGGDVGLGGGFDSVATIDVANDSLRVDYVIAATEFGAPREVSEIIIGDIGYVDGANSNVAPPGQAPLLSDRVASIRTHQELLNPHLLLIDVLADPSIATADDGSIEIAHGPTPITVTLDSATGLPVEASTLESSPLRRDVELVVTYADWAETPSGVSFPAGVSISYDGSIVHEETRTVATGTQIDPSIFALPDGIDPVFDADLALRGDINHQYLQDFEAIGFPLDGFQPSIMATGVVGPGIFHITGGSHHSMAIEQDDGVVILEAPLNEVRTEAILGWAAQQFPDKPVTHVVQSHHHIDHAAGLRSMAGANGATAVVGESAVPFYQDKVFGADSDVVSDGIDGSSIGIVGVGPEPVVLPSEMNPVTVHAFPNPHAEDYVLVESSGALWVVDIYNPGLGFGAPPPELFDWVDANGIEVFQVIGGHGGTDMWPDLVAARDA